MKFQLMLSLTSCCSGGIDGWSGSSTCTFASPHSDCIGGEQHKVTDGHWGSGALIHCILCSQACVLHMISEVDPITNRGCGPWHLQEGWCTTTQCNIKWNRGNYRGDVGSIAGHSILLYFFGGYHSTIFAVWSPFLELQATYSKIFWHIQEPIYGATHACSF